MPRWLTWLFIVLGVSVLVAAIAFPTAAWWQERNAPKFLTATITKGRVETVVNSSGTIKPVRTVAVGAFTSGPIKDVRFDFNGEITKPEEILAVIDDKLQSAAVKRDEAAVATQEAERTRIQALLKQAAKNLIRADKLKKANPQFISETEYDQFKYGVETLEAQVKLADAAILQAKANLQNSQEQLSYTKIRGPKEIDADNPDPKKRVKGIVIDRKVDPGQTVAATFQTPELFTIALEMDRHVYVYASVDEADIGVVRNSKAKNRPVEFTVDAYPGELFKGTIHDIRLNSTTLQNVVTYPVVIDAPNQVIPGPKIELKLKPGMTANITFPIDAKENIVRVPMSALRFTPAKELVHPDDRHLVEAATSGQAMGGARRTAGEKADLAQRRQNRIVWIQDGKLVRAVPVTIGLSDHRHAELVKGDLKDGDVVVAGTEGAFTPK
ncbi:MAG: HlyD family efflux transporter periplasmic adaptor subunit [Planctomycetes bacterium]|nr:HlyD family efflux transporter periplasmic adaptor subunit [Planctomycetota bacterium]